MNLLLILACILEIVADVCFKESKLLFGYLALGIGTILWAYFLKENGFAKSLVIFAMLNLVASALIGYFYFKEVISLKQMSAILLAIIAIYLYEG